MGIEILGQLWFKCGNFHKNFVGFEVLICLCIVKVTEERGDSTAAWLSFVYQSITLLI